MLLIKSKRILTYRIKKQKLRKRERKRKKSLKRWKIRTSLNSSRLIKNRKFLPIPKKMNSKKEIKPFNRPIPKIKPMINRIRLKKCLPKPRKSYNLKNLSFFLLPRWRMSLKSAIRLETIMWFFVREATLLDITI